MRDDQANAQKPKPTPTPTNSQLDVNFGEIHLHVHLDQAAASDPRIAEILSAVQALTKGVQKMAGELDSLTAEVEKNTSVDQSAIALLQGLKKQLDAAGTDPQKLQDLKDQLAASSDALANAVAANTPADPNSEPHPDQTLPGDL